MAVQKIEEYRMKNGDNILKVFCKPTKEVGEGYNYFYAPAEAIDLVQGYTWRLAVVGNNIYVKGKRWGTNIRFHQELFNFYHGYYIECIDHINQCGFDNTDNNLNAVTRSQNSFNRFRKGYSYSNKGNYFHAEVCFNAQTFRPFSIIHREDEVCKQQNLLEGDYLKDVLAESWYRFDFMKYRKGSEDILDLERTGVISEEEATYRHIMRYADNAWYYLRYGLQDYFQQYNIPIPKYSLDEQGFMIHPITGEKLCPFYK